MVGFRCSAGQADRSTSAKPASVGFVASGKKNDVFTLGWFAAGGKKNGVRKDTAFRSSDTTEAKKNGVRRTPNSFWAIAKNYFFM